jgi:uncharacterized phage protein (TIGR01671 family)
MREIKFRAWHEKNKAFEYFTVKDIWKNGVDCVRAGGYSAEHSKTPMSDDEITESTFVPNVEFEQYTGLKDNNDKEIYEGDILKFCSEKRHKNFGLLFCEWDEKRARFQCRLKNKEAVSFHVDFWNDMEIIGNINEAPELLED